MRRWVIALHCLLLSCASPHEERSVTLYDGDWQALMRDTEAVQMVQDLRFDCAHFTEPFFLRVKDGVVAGFMQADENYSFTTRLDSKGRFNALIPTNSVYIYKDQDVTRDSRIVLILSGRLSAQERTGVFVVGDSALDGQGCSTTVQFVSV